MTKKPFPPVFLPDLDILSGRDLSSTSAVGRKDMDPHMRPTWSRPWLLLLAFLFLMSCSQSSTGSAWLDRLINVDYGSWGKAIKDHLGLYEKELKKLNPQYENASRESITHPVQRVILSLFAMQKKEGVIVELGSWTGGGALLMAPFLKRDQSYHAVDTFNADHMPDEYIQEYLRGRKHLDVFKANILPLKKKVVIYQGTTIEIAAKWPKDRMIDLLFIDADHSYAAVSADWRNWSPFVRKGGIIAFHDYYVKTKGGHPGVRRFVDENIVDTAGKNFHYVEGLAWYIVE
jgi:predicted O-methyltransferase YrrM